MLQRGNAKLSWFWHGDPLTPGVGATADAARLDPKTAPTLPKIPVVVLSAARGRPTCSPRSADPSGRRRSPAAIDGATRVGPGPAALRVVGRHGPGRAPDLRRRRVAEGHADAGARRAPRHAPRRLDLRRRRSRHRHDRDARNGQGPRPAGQGRLAAAAHDLAGVLGRRGVRAGRLDRVRRGAQGAAPGAARHVREHRHVHEGALRSRRRAVAARRSSPTSPRTSRPATAASTTSGSSPNGRGRRRRAAPDR